MEAAILRGANSLDRESKPSGRSSTSKGTRMATTYTLHLDPAEERLAQLLTRDAWTYFSNLISKREIFHIKDVPMMPRGGILELPDDLEIAQYYADMAATYVPQLEMYGISAEEGQAACQTFVAKIEVKTGIRRGMKSSEMAAI